MKYTLPKNPEQHHDVLVTFDRALGLLLGDVFDHLPPKDLTAVQDALSAGAGELRVGVMLQPVYSVGVYLHFPAHPEQPLALATLLVPDEPPAVFSDN